LHSHSNLSEIINGPGIELGVDGDAAGSRMFTGNLSGYAVRRTSSIRQMPRKHSNILCDLATNRAASIPGVK
jgi:hypothetical protein